MTAHAELARLEQRITEAKRAERGAQQDLGTAERSVEAARDAVREAHDLGADAKPATRTLGKAKEGVEQAQLAREGVGRRVTRAVADRDAWYGLQAEVSRLLVAQRRRRADAAPGGHQLAEVVRLPRRSPDSVRSPMPNARVPAAVA